jgi:preprotein translocase subunit YajC
MQLAFLVASADESSPNILVSLLPFLVIGFIMYLLLIRPQRKRMREQAQLQSNVGVGDEIVTTTGIFGFITGEDGPNRFWLEIDDDVQIRIARAAVQSKVDTTTEDDSDDAKPTATEAKEAKDAKQAKEATATDAVEDDEA